MTPYAYLFYRLCFGSKTRNFLAWIFMKLAEQIINVQYIIINKYSIYKH